MVSNVLIDVILENISNYKGCYALDEINLLNPQSSKSTASYVINTYEKTIYQGGHWILATYFPKTGQIEVFDSLGSPRLIPSTILKHLQKFAKQDIPSTHWPSTSKNFVLKPNIQILSNRPDFITAMKLGK